MKPEQISLAAARRIALAAQGFGQRNDAARAATQLSRTLRHTHLLQIDSVNVLVRAHYMPIYSRTGPYDRAYLDGVAWGPRSKRRLFEYWAHEASLLPLSIHPLLRWRMAEAERGEAGWRSLRAFASERRPEAERVLERIRDKGPLAASDFPDGRSKTGWWEWGSTKQALEWLFWSGKISVATRRKAFERVYDVTERVIPRAVLELPTPPEEAAKRELVLKAAEALGIATLSELRDYFRLSPADTRAAVELLESQGELIPARIDGWSQKAWLHAGARRPRAIADKALLSPFDPIVWERKRAERLFDFHYRIEIYTPAEKRMHGYYVLPFLLGDQLVARVDLKADRRAGLLNVLSVHVEDGAPGETRKELEQELHRLAAWLRLSSSHRDVASRSGPSGAAVAD